MENGVGSGAAGLQETLSPFPSAALTLTWRSQPGRTSGGVRHCYMDNEPKWQESNIVPGLAAEEVHVWRLSLDAVNMQQDSSVLSLDEERRALAFHFERDRNSYFTTRTALRILLGHYFGCQPEDVRLEYEAAGKPFVCGESGICFNVSHSNQLAQLAFTKQVAVGVDIESQRPGIEIEELAERFFAGLEREAMRGASEAEKRQLFYRIWSAKEACVKAIGQGLQILLDEFSVHAVGEEDALALEILLQDGPRQQETLDIGAAAGWFIEIRIDRNSQVMGVAEVEGRLSCGFARGTAVAGNGFKPNARISGIDSDRIYLLERGVVRAGRIPDAGVNL